MRRCPYCAEDIDDDVTRCPHCGSNLATAPGGAVDGGIGSADTPPPTVVSPTPAGVPPPGVGSAPQGSPWQAPPAQPVQFSHTGQRFLLGYDATDFGIWDRSSPGAPVERFPRSDDGWSQAWRRYASLEPGNQPVQAATAPPPSGAAAPVAGWPQPAYQPPYQQTPYQQSHARPTPGTNGMAVASLVLGLVGLVTFWLVAVPNILAIVFGFVGRNQIRNSGGVQEGDGLAIAGIVLGIVGSVIFVIVLLATINDRNF
jgi:hypothetical protein